MADAPMDALRQVADLMRPSTLRVLRRAGVLQPRAVLSLTGALPRFAGRGGSLGLLSHIHARSQGHRPAIHDRRGTISWGELDGRANQLARGLQEHGAGAGARIATVLRNGRELVEVILATQKLGAEVSPLNTWAKPAELRSALEGMRPAMLIYDERHAEQVAAAAPVDLTMVLVASDALSAAGRVTYEELLGGRPTRPLAPIARNRGAPRILIHTSGTTGRPKAARRGGGAEVVRPMVDLLSVIPLHRRDVILCSAPLFHSFGLLTLTLGTMLGATFVLPDRFDPRGTLELVERHAITACAFIPVMLHRIAALPDETTGEHDMSGVRVVMVSGSALPPSLREEATKVFGRSLYDLYGSTEAGWVAVATPEDVERRPSSVGRPVPGVDVAVLSPDGERLPPGEVGSLFVGSDFVFEGYTSGEETDQRDGRLGIGDLGHLDEEGYLYVDGRADDMVVVGGENVYPIEVEEVVRRVAGVEDVAVAGVHDPEYGQVLVAFIAGDAPEERILEACRAELASFKVPRRIERVAELPRTGTGKVLIRELISALDEKE